MVPIAAAVSKLPGFHGVGDIRLDNVAEPQIQHPQDAIVRITESAICGTGLHMVRGTITGMVPGTITGHEIVGVYLKTVNPFGIGTAMGKNLRLHMGDCPHRRYIPQLMELVRAGNVTPLKFLTEECPFTDVIDAYKHFDRPEPGWPKVALSLSAQKHKAA